MLGFSSYSNLLNEANLVGGIGHIEHPSDRVFDGEKAARHAVSTIRGVALGRTPVTRKIDDRMSFQVIRDQQGRVGVKYKGSGSTYNFSNDEIERQHGQKPYLVKPLRELLAHAPKVIPSRQGEWQGGYMSAPEDRTEKGGKTGHTPNTISYSVKKDSPEGKKLAKSKVSMTIHTELKGPNRKPHPIEDQSEFRDHPDVHLVNHVVRKEDQKLSPEAKKAVLRHISSAQTLMKGHDYSHLTDHDKTLRTYVNSTVDSGERTHVEGYKKHLADRWEREIAKVKTEKAKKQKMDQRDAALAHVDANREAFQRSLDIHHHIQQATNTLADNMNRTAHGGVSTEIGGKPSGGEGFVAKGLKVVNRDEFSKANRERSKILRAKK